jgi:hypothetical protein
MFTKFTKGQHEMFETSQYKRHKGQHSNSASTRYFFRTVERGGTKREYMEGLPPLNKGNDS